MTAPTTPVLTTVPRVELGEVGTWNISNIPNWHPTADDFASAVAALGCPAVRRPVLKLGHTGDHGAGDPALGYIANMAVTDNGQVLIGDYAGIPAWLAAEDAQGRSVLASAYPDRSGEWEHGYVCQLGHTHPFVLHAMSLLGVDRPGIGTLQSLHDLYTTPPTLEPLMPAASLPSADGQVSAAATTDDVRKAYYAGPASGNWDLYVREMYVDPPELIVQNDADDTLLRVPYSITAKGVVTFGDPQPVKVTYVAARAAASGPVVAYASAAEARPGRPPTTPEPPAPTPAAGTPSTLEGPGMDPVKLREALGLPAEASEDEMDTAYVAARSASPPTPTPPAVTPPVQPVVDLTPAAPQLAVAASRGLPPGVVAIDATQLAEFQASIKRADAVARQVQGRHRDDVIAAAVAGGKFPPARRKHWEALWDADPEGTEQVIETLQANLVPLAAAGYAGGDAGEDAGYLEFAHLFPPEPVTTGKGR